VRMFELSTRGQRRGFYGLVFFLGLSLLVPKETAASVTKNVSVLTSATVPAALTLNVTIIDQTTNSAVPTMDFGELQRVGDEFRSATYFKVLLKVDTVGDPLNVTQIGSPLTRAGGVETIPSGAYIAEPTYSDTDNGGKSQPAGSHLDIRRTVAGTHDIYSDSSGSKRFISIFYRLSGDPATGGTEVIPLDQKSGAYSGTVQFTLTSS